MKSNQGEFQPFVLSFLMLFLHRITMFGDAEIPCNRTCGSRTVEYPFGFSGGCPYMLDRDCSGSECGNVYLKGFQVLDFTNSSIIIQPWRRENNKLKCYDQDVDILSIFKPQFGLTNRNVLLLSGNSTEYDINFNITDLRRIGSKYYDGRENCSTNVSAPITCLTSNTSEWFPWKSLETSTCKYFLNSFISHGDAYNGSFSFDVDKVELGWWVNGTCLRNSCSAHAECSQFQNPNNNNETVHRCYCNQGFEGDGVSEGLGCHKGKEMPWFSLFI
jgi:hypothetical protein